MASAEIFGAQGTSGEVGMVHVGVRSRCWSSPDSGVRRKKFRGFKVMAGLVGGPGRGAPPRTPENFRKCAKNALFEHIFQKI